MKASKRVKANDQLVDRSKSYSIEEAIELIKKTANTKFTGSVEIHVRTNIEAKKTEQAIRGSVTLPHGTGKTKKIAAFVSESKEKEATAAGASMVGGEDLIKQIKESGKTDFDIAIAEPAMMPKLAVIAKLLGPRGLMPNPKTGTVSDNITQMVKEISGGKISFKNDSSGNVHTTIGRTNFETKNLIENYNKFLEALEASKPATVKKQLIAAIYLNATMGPSIPLKK